MVKGIVQVIFGMFLLVSAMAASATPMLVIDSSGEFTGARNIDVDGVLYDVDLVDGRCDVLFNGCRDSANMHPFNDYSDLMSGMVGLSRLVENSFSGLYDDRPELTLGCEDLVMCLIAVPIYAHPDHLGLLRFVNITTEENPSTRSTRGDDYISITDIDKPTFTGYDPYTASTFDTSISPYTYAFISARYTFARWSVTPPSVPEPSVIALFGIGLAGIALARVRRATV